MRPRRDLTDADILAALEKHRSGCMTYVLRNILSDGRRFLRTQNVRDRLMRLERQGKVTRKPSSYKTQICWALVEKDKNTNEEPQS